MNLVPGMGTWRCKKSETNICRSLPNKGEQLTWDFNESQKTETESEQLFSRPLADILMMTPLSGSFSSVNAIK